MKKIKSLLITVGLGLPLLAYAQDPNSICCNGLAPPSPGATQLPMLSKFALDVPQACPTGTAMRAISFSHKNGENLTFQESFGLQCAPSSSVVTNQCVWGQFKSNFPLSTRASAANDSVIAGVRFTHQKDQNFTYQQSFAIMTCKLAHPKSRAGIHSGGGFSTKWHLQSYDSCSQTFGGQVDGLAIALGFQHPKGENGTHQEQVFLDCSQD